PITREQSHELDNHMRFIRISPPLSLWERGAGSIACGFNRYKNHRHSVRGRALVRSNASSKPSFIEEAIRDFHDLRMHAVLRLEQCHILGVTLQPLKHRMPKLARANHGWKLAIVSNKNETARGKDQCEGAG